ncbi:hypothetical protein Y696_11480 [Mesotoga sp. H07pep.5.4]|uniref:MarR family winged helix-turn-helix transcriptional regulator n=1 Tax=Mesotoga sp. H07pep.5.4 TaxID=1463664 RepID=UPI000EF16380|nr:MarR family transcriptional regulator [Mesotoga sp. H07pep.5.4]RLL84870.1 hypothetical protein Y696_11480 [Mesotoga sp. H07pep.5.4]
MIFDDKIGSLFEKIASLHINLSRHARLALEPHGITYPQFGALLVLSSRGEMTQKQLSSHLETDTTNTMVICVGLEKKQLITREQSSEDKRANIVSITAKGREIFQKSMAVLRESYGPTANSISEKERDTVNSVLDKLLESLNTLR